jgi:hypothetical protein
MAYDRYDRGDDRQRWRDDSNSERAWRGNDRSGRRDERGFFERAGDEISSWFGDDDAERRRREDQMRDQRERGFGGQDRNRDRDRDRDWNENRGLFSGGGSSERDYGRGSLSGMWNRGRDDHRSDRFGERDHDYRPMTGDYGRGYEADRFSSNRNFDRSERSGSYDRGGDNARTPWGRDDYRNTSRAGTWDQSDRSRHDRDTDPHYRNWRDRQMSELDRDYDDYRREHQSKFESEFGSWRETRQQKRGLLGQVREHMEVVGNDDQHVGTVDKVAGDRIILTKSDPDAGGAHHSLSCSTIDRIEENRVILDCSADQARKNWRDESRSRALFERDDQGEMGPRILDRSFEGTYR